MSKLYLMRHGETYFNLWHKIQGWCDSPLTESGIKQAQAARQYFLDKNIHFDAAYCSTSERASDTLEIVTNHTLSYHRLKGLKECYFGSFEGQDERLNPKPPYGDFFVQYAGESQNQVQTRMLQALTKIMITARENDNVLVVSHAGACFNFLTAIQTDPQELLTHRLGNCAIIDLTYSNQHFSLNQIINPN
ncbi:MULTISPECIES: histidine phosphatase family protein [Lactobacillus]|uniref:Histidine phosphatase family protein n=1 Tax=Lactobacillus xujianguonis TaxID=2495899 RepID=A0A437SUK5_9LACO|nr:MULTISPECIES: histidine phosphatase family protein [Lactobacillus]RVU70611.1 histidine phosphatase family protein [Lactobacillus xujianguonis]RVU73853.1 histidine phosphatase family protein [Lactobacillus xujianguonis]